MGFVIYGRPTLIVRIEGRQFSSSRGDCHEHNLCLNCGHDAGQHYYLEIRNTAHHPGECAHCSVGTPCPQLVPDIPSIRAIVAAQREMVQDRPDIDEYIERYLEGIV